MIISKHFVYLLLVGMQAVGLAQTTVGASGSLTVGGRATNLAFARALKAPQYSFGTDGKPVLDTMILVLVSDAPAEDLEDDFELGIRSKAGKFHGLLLTFNKNGEASSGTIYHDALESGSEGIFVSHVAFESMSVNSVEISGMGRSTEPISLSSA
ncbi:MAG TPA: hypothetical protein VMM37_04225, partial [Bacteroidota bacterium]|nr:hypothetical protein [Bacteroidota bacterium]